jgi:ferric-dicitrate binding protein FerR (iron transport regulator)
MIAFLPMLRNLPWKWIGAGLLVVGAIIWLGRFEDKAYKSGERAERARWEAAQAKETERLRLAYDNAAKLSATRAEARADTFRPIEQRKDAYARSAPAAAACPDPGGVDIMRQAVAAANADVAATAR